MPTFLGLLLIPAYGAANRFAGGGLGWDRLGHKHGGPLRGHPVVYAGLFALAVGLGLGALQDPSLAAPWAFLGLSWAICRSIIIGEDWATPDDPMEIILAFVRHGLVALAGWLIGTVFELPRLAPALLLWAAAATGLAIWYAAKERKAIRQGRRLKSRFNVFVEAAQGGALGLAIWGGSVPLAWP